MHAGELWMIREHHTGLSAFRALVPGQLQGHSLRTIYFHAPTAVQYSTNSTFI